MPVGGRDLLRCLLCGLPDVKRRTLFVVQKGVPAPPLPPLFFLLVVAWLGFWTCHTYVSRHGIRMLLLIIYN